MNCGIYIIKNLINNKVYIGQSINIDKRLEVHKQNAFNETCKEYDKCLYKAIRKYGLNNFSFEILEKCTEEDLNERECYWIKHYDSYNNGYNCTIGGNNRSEKGEAHFNHILTTKDVIDIRTKYKNHERKKKVYEQYSDQISKSGFHKIWTGVTWKNVMPEVYTKENIEFHKFNTANKGSENGMANVFESDIIFIRTSKKKGKDSKEIYELFKNKLTYKSFLQIWYYQNWKDVVV